MIWFVSEFPALGTLGLQNYSNLCKLFIHYENETLFMQFNFQKVSSLSNKMHLSNSIVELTRNSLFYCNIEISKVTNFEIFGPELETLYFLLP